MQIKDANMKENIEEKVKVNLEFCKTPKKLLINNCYGKNGLEKLEHEPGDNLFVLGLFIFIDDHEYNSKTLKLIFCSSFIVSWHS